MNFIKDIKGQSEWNTLYMILILAIVAIVLIAIVKPMFRDSISTGSKTQGVSTPAGN